MTSDSNHGRTVAVVTGPAGAGKTVLLAQRIAQLCAAAVPSAWLSLDSDDNDADVLWTGIQAAIIRAVRGLGTEVDMTLSRWSARGGDAAGFWGELCASIEFLSPETWLIIDDVHEIVAGEALDVLVGLLESRAAPMRIVLAGRFVPRALAAVLPAEDVFEIGASDLAFDQDEALALLRDHDVELAGDDLDLLYRRTEGWAAGLRMAALSLQGQEDTSKYVVAMAEDDRPIADYLLSEVLADQSPETMTFLRATSVPDWLSEDLAVALSRRGDAGRILDRLAHDNVLVFRTGSSQRGYRYHPLLRDYLKPDLAAYEPFAQRPLHRAAAPWFRTRGSHADAQNHSAEAEVLGPVGRDYRQVLAGGRQP